MESPAYHYKSKLAEPVSLTRTCARFTVKQVLTVDFVPVVCLKTGGIRIGLDPTGSGEV